MAGLLPSILQAGGCRKASAPFVAALLAVLIGGCGSNDNDPGPGGVTVGEARALDEAAEMLDSQRLPKEAVTTSETSSEPTESPSAQPSE